LPKTISARALKEQSVTAASVAAAPRVRMKNDFRFMRQFLSEKCRTAGDAERENDERRTNDMG
jgi:hypothetical protein